jgi:GDP/UDP-N,N'-diacetylbacillosamine 2-epimerase (hydrolysing)
MKYATAVLGNSSSGIVEAPSFKIPAVNIGDRQKGRVRAKSVMDCEPAAISIASSIRKAISPEFQEVLKFAKNPYEQSDTACRIVSVIAAFDPAGLLKKRFYNMPIAGPI